jgi:hypothetical protein
VLALSVIAAIGGVFSGLFSPHEGFEAVNVKNMDAVAAAQLRARAFEALQGGFDQLRLEPGDPVEWLRSELVATEAYSA